MKELTPEQLKTLKLFAYYCQSYGAEEVNQDWYISAGDCMAEIYRNEWYQSHGSPIPGYDKIDELIENIINENDLPAQGEDRDCENSARLDINIDCKEKTIEIKIGEWRQDQRDLGDSEELGDDEDFANSIFKHMKENNLERGFVEFNGGGDSGDIYDRIDYNDGSFGKLTTAVESYLYTWLENFYGGWEINEGSHGNFHFYPNGLVELEFYEHTEDFHGLGQVFYAKF